MKFYIIAGEASGDLHASNLVKSLKALDSTIELKGFGGDLMREAGVSLSVHYKELAVMGFIDVLKKIFSLSRYLKKCKEDIENFRPDGIIFIDFSGFNLRIAHWAHERGIKTHYYIAPQIWASRAKRIYKIKRDIDHMYVTLPFELEFYNQHQYPVHFVGHPLLDALKTKAVLEKSSFKTKHSILPERPLIALLPGSRKSEINYMLPVMASVTKKFPHCEFALAIAPSIDLSFYQSLCREGTITFIENDTYSLLNAADFALVTSGTATLETALLKVPQLVCYKTQALTYWIAKKIIQLPYISLVNIILKQEAVPELIQGDFNAKTLETELRNLMKKATFQKQLERYQQLETLLGSGGASRKTATLLIENT